MLVVFVLTYESDCALSIVFVKRRHVEVIDKVDQLVLAYRSIDFPSATLKLRLQNGLEEQGVGVEVEVDDLLEIFVSLRGQIIQHTFDDLGLTAASLANEER